MQAAPPGWYTDPADSRQLRWWDGSQWTLHVHVPVVAAPIAQPAAQPGIVAAAARKPRRWLLPVVIVASCLVVALIVSGAIAAISIGGHAFSSVQQTLSLTSLQLRDSDAPAKMGRATDSPSAPTTAGAALNADRNDAAIPNSCDTLLYLAPMKPSDAGSKDRVQPLGTFAGASPKGTDNPWVQATAREYSSAAAATAQLKATATAVRRCHNGYSSTNFSADRLTAAHPQVKGMQIVGWAERDTGMNTAQRDEYYVLDFQKGDVVVRATCDIPNGSTYTVSTCAQWWGTIAGKLSALKAG